MLKKIITVFCTACLVLMNISVVMAADGMSDQVRPAKQCVAAYNDPDNKISLSANPIKLYGTGEYGQLSSMAFYSFNTSGIASAVPSGKNLKHVFFALYDTSNDNEGTDLGIRIYAHKVHSDYTSGTSYTNGTGPDYTDTPFAESIYNNVKYINTAYGASINHDYFIDITSYYLDLLAANESTITLGISCNKIKADESSIGTSDMCSFNSAGRIFVEYSDDVQNINYAPSVSGITVDSTSAPVGGTVGMSATVNDASGVDSVYFKIADIKTQADYNDATGKYEADAVVPTTVGEYNVTVIATDSDGAVNTVRAPSKISAVNDAPVVNCDLVDVVAVSKDRSFNLSVSDYDNNVASVKVSVDDNVIEFAENINENIYSKSVTIPAEHLTSGTHNVVIEAVDNYSVKTVKTVAIKADYAAASNVVVSTNIVAGSTMNASMDITNVYDVKKKIAVVYGLYNDKGSLVALSIKGDEFEPFETISLSASFAVPSDADVTKLYTELYIWETGGIFRPLLTGLE